MITAVCVFVGFLWWSSAVVTSGLWSGGQQLGNEAATIEDFMAHTDPML
jgi:hypothetical protein